MTEQPLTPVRAAVVGVAMFHMILTAFCYAPAHPQGGAFMYYGEYFDFVRRPLQYDIADAAFVSLTVLLMSWIAFGPASFWRRMWLGMLGVTLLCGFTLLIAPGIPPLFGRRSTGAGYRIALFTPFVLAGVALLGSATRWRWQPLDADSPPQLLSLTMFLLLGWLSACLMSVIRLIYLGATSFQYIRLPRDGGPSWLAPRDAAVLLLIVSAACCVVPLIVASGRRLKTVLIALSPPVLCLAAVAITGRNLRTAGSLGLLTLLTTGYLLAFRAVGWRILYVPRTAALRDD